MRPRRRTGRKENTADAEHKPSSTPSVKKRDSEAPTVGNPGGICARQNSELAPGCAGGGSRRIARPGQVATAGGGRCADRISQRARQDAALIDDGRHHRSEAPASAGPRAALREQAPAAVRAPNRSGQRAVTQLYLHGLAQGDFELALRGLLGDGAPLSASSIERLRAKWHLEFETWRSRRLDQLEVVYAWADGLYVKAGLEDSTAALLVIVGALRDGRKVVLAIESGQRESKESWARVLRDLFARGLRPWRATVADGHLGIWSALGEVFPDGAELRCWNHRLTNVIDHLPKKEWSAARELLRKMPYVLSRAECE